jgi:hypothetical protein
MTTFVSNFFSINGAIDTSKSVIDNLNDIATAAGAFLTYDVAEGKWAVVINTTGSSVATFTDSNIIGNIDISGTGLTELYNSATIQFPNKDLRGATDYVDVKVDDSELYENEIENRLNFTIPLINDSAQAQYIATTELKQSRIDKIINFRTDYSYLGLKAGDLIDITNTAYGYTNKIFRVVKVEEDDSENLTLSISALEYDATIYSTSGLTIANRTKRTKIPPRNTNTAMTAADDTGVSDQLNRLMLANIALGLLNPKTSGLISGLIKMLTGKDKVVDADGNPVLDAETEAADKVLGGAKAPSLSTISAGGTLCEGASKTITVGHSCSSCLFDIPPIKYNYAITGVSAADISIPLTGTVTVTNGSGSLTFTATADGTTEGSETATVTIGNLTTTVTIYDVLDYTLSATRNNASITEGGSSIVTLTATGSKAAATIPYTITGTATGKVTTPLTGNVTTVGGSATLTIATTDDSLYTGTQGITVTFGTATGNPCSTGTASTSITVLDNDTAPPTPPADTTCSYVSVPAVWCGTFDGTTNVLKGITVRSYVMLPVPQAGEATVFVPYECSVSGGSIVVDEEIEVAAASVSVGGTPVRLITSFNAVPNKGIITGSTVTLYGY